MRFPGIATDVRDQSGSTNMKRRLLNIVRTPEQLLQMSPDELAQALLKDMQARKLDPIAPRASKTGLGNELVTPSLFGQIGNPSELKGQLNRAGKQSYEILERNGFVELESGINGLNGYLVLTPQGLQATEAVDYHRIRVRRLLKEEMLHPALKGKIYNDYAAGELDIAVNEAFRTVEIEVRVAANLPEKENRKPIAGKDLMYRAFNIGGPLSLPTDGKAEAEEIACLFAGAISKFRNPSSHTRRTFEDVLEAMEELMFASRLLRLIDERRPQRTAK